MNDTGSEPRGEFANRGEPAAVCTCTLGHKCGPDGCECTGTIMECAVHAYSHPGRVEADEVQRAELATDLEAAGFGGCAYDLQAADEPDVVQVAYDIAANLTAYAAYTDGDEEIIALAAALEVWADRHEHLYPPKLRLRSRIAAALGLPWHLPKNL